MAIPKKKSRIITIEDKRYSYVISGNDDIINVIICLEKNSGQKLISSFHYVQESNDDLVETKITPLIIRKLIIYAFKYGWNPDQKKKNMKLLNLEFSQLEI